MSEHIQQQIERLVPPRYRKIDPKTHPATAQRLEELKAWIESPTQNLLITGSCGTGKTVTAYITLRALLRLCKDVRFVNAEDLYWHWRKHDGKRSPAAFQEPDILIIDDLGQADITDAYKRWLYGLINHRWEWEKPTMVTTNLTSQEIRDKYGDAMLSRMADGLVWKYEGKDHRLEHLKTKHGTSA